MSYKNDKELKKGQKKWKSPVLQFVDPDGYQQHLADVKAYKSGNSSTSSGTTTTTTSESDDKKKDKRKWERTDSEKATHDANVDHAEKAAWRARRYKPKKIGGIKPREYKLDSPKRPSVPKLPKLNIPGGGLTIGKVKKPSGLPGTINSYSPKSDYSKSYPNALPKKKGKKK